MFLFIINFGWSVNKVEYMACNLYVKKIIFKYGQWDIELIVYEGLQAQ